MFYDEHNPPHFHAEYAGHKVVITIKEGIVKGEMPKRALKLVFEWMEKHQEQLIENWELAMKGEHLKRIEPLVMNMDLIWVEWAEYIEDYKVRIAFSDGKVKTVNLENHLEKKVFQPLKDVRFFRKFKINPFTIEWENGADFAPEFLYSIGE